MTVMYLTPYSYNGVRIDGTGAIDSQSFHMNFPKVLTRIIPVAGGSLFDYNYGLGAKLLPVPFDVAMVVAGGNEVTAAAAYNDFFGLPPTGFYGMTCEFKAKEHGGTRLLTMDSEMTKVVTFQETAWYTTTKKIFSNIKVTFTPTNLYYAVEP
ncbi:hypothetical protein DRQ25_07150 [Candidatus Fermentibacteria bacterium]|nr:MAG: hypothetical protein DRQ25_07150 [Candidatus Fermentibacteria bacterium]